MPEIKFSDHELPSQAELVALYDSVDWTNYTRDPLRLYDAVGRSLRVVSARLDEQLIGLARIVGDGLTIVYVQDILVHPNHQRGGIGRRLLAEALAPYEDVRQKVLITDDEARQRAFYESMGFTEISDMDHPIRAFVQFS